jgi:hypothetical protein
MTISGANDGMTTVPSQDDHPPAGNPETALQQALIDAGLLRPKKATSLQSSSPAIVRRLVQVQGEPVSETIIKERR